MTLNLRSPLAWLSMLALCVGTLSAQEHLLPVSRTTGALTVALPINKTTLIGLPLVGIVASGTFSAVNTATNELTLTTSVPLPALTGPHGIKVTSRVDQRGTGANAPGVVGDSRNAYGQSASISNQAAQVVTSALAVLPNVGDEFVIYKLATISSVFGATNSLGLTAGTTAATADVVYLGSTGALVGYFYNSADSNWRLVTSPATGNQGNTVIHPTTAILVARKNLGAASLSLIQTGELLPGRQIATVTTGFQVINNPFTVSTTLAASAFDQFITGGSGAASADVLYLEDAGVLTGYYFKTGGLGGTGWRSITDATTNQGAVLVAPGKAILFKEQAGTAGFAMQEPFAE